MLLMLAALARAEGNADYAARHWPVVQKWAEYLRQTGWDPAEQLCTDDFSGHLAHNVNLSAKATLALGAFAGLADQLGKKDVADDYRKTAREFAAQWVKTAADGDHFRLAFDRPGTWSQKYNLVWDRVLGLGLFPPRSRARKPIGIAGRRSAMAFRSTAGRTGPSWIGFSGRRR